MSIRKNNIIIQDAAQVICFKDNHEFCVLENTDVLIKNGKIKKVGKNLGSKFDIHNCEIINASGKVAMPGLIDCHTHFIFTGSREDEFEEKIKGVPYLEIAKKGGGILNTVRNVRKSSKEELIKDGYKKLNSFVRNGVTTVEVKSGYGLNTESEIKMLEAANELNRIHPVNVVSTFLGAHVVPAEYINNKQRYIDIINEQMIPEVSGRKLAEFCDVFLEDGAFDLKDTESILKTGKKYGLIPKIHSEQFNSLGGIKLAIDLEAASVDHLDAIREQDIKLLSASNVVGVFLPGAVFFLGLDNYVPARECIDSGVGYAVSTDFNPGSCMTENLFLICTIACTQLRMTPAECIKAVTVNAAGALNRNNIGNIREGLDADVIILNCENYKYPFYHFGINHVDKVIKNGKILLKEGTELQIDNII